MGQIVWLGRKQQDILGRVGFELGAGIATLDMWTAEILLAPALVAEQLVGQLCDDEFGALCGDVFSGDVDRVPRSSQVTPQLVG